MLADDRVALVLLDDVLEQIRMAIAASAARA